MLWPTSLDKAGDLKIESICDGRTETTNGAGIGESEVYFYGGTMAGSGISLLSARFY